MTIRVFRCRVKPGMQNEFDQFFREKAIPLLQAHEGLVALHAGKPMEFTPDEFVMITVWKDLDALKSFTGAQYREAKILPEEARLMKEVSVYHYESIDR